MSQKSFRALGVSADVDAGARPPATSTMPFRIQELVIPAALTGADVLAKSPTGSGKTFAFAPPDRRARRAAGADADRARARPDA